MKPKTNSEKLRAVADWINTFNKKFPSLVDDCIEVEKDLRAMADDFEKLQQHGVVRPASALSEGGELLKSEGEEKGVSVGDLVYMHTYGKTK